MTKLTDKKEIELFLRKNLALNLYSIGDLDDFFWPHTTFYGRKKAGNLLAVVMLYKGGSVPSLLALGDEKTAISELLQSIIPELPDIFYSHLSPGLEEIFSASFAAEFHGNHLKMFLTHLNVPADERLEDVIQLKSTDLRKIEKLYAESYPDNWFDARMLQTGRYFGFFMNENLVSIAGVHVYSQEYGVAALGNITTLPSFRGKGLGKLVTSKLCQVLQRENLSVGLNVKSDNVAAIKCYKKLGFSETAPYLEFEFSKTRAILES